MQMPSDSELAVVLYLQRSINGSNFQMYQFFLNIIQCLIVEGFID
jgi:hypothetical protein